MFPPASWSAQRCSRYVEAWRRQSLTPPLQASARPHPQAQLAGVTPVAVRVLVVVGSATVVLAAVGLVRVDSVVLAVRAAAAVVALAAFSSDPEQPL
jgi:hypothetical protein